ncbi:hypothetical protein AVEN_48099-1 [Araneus ventricosus]|uniref:Uncharacterized protein n=1 Tax=Araneus ventricosus TaxID=182803 RepID=A0A4Y2X170_ARAVE|nr:hypothetical protein AVEN_48099-1 [Araneus ventricosus]
MHYDGGGPKPRRYAPGRRTSLLYVSAILRRHGHARGVDPKPTAIIRSRKQNPLLSMDSRRRYDCDWSRVDPNSTGQYTILWKENFTYPAIPEVMYYDWRG